MAEFDKEKELQETTLEPSVETQDSANGAERVDTSLKWIDKVLKMLNKYSAKKVLQAILIVFVIIFLGLFAFKPESVFKSYDDYREQTHSERMDKRTDVTPQIQEELDRFRKQYDISWAAVWEFHNNTNNLDGLPFIFVSLNYESRNPALTPIADQFDDVRVSLYPLVTYLRQNDMWYGSVDDLLEVDNTAYYRAKALGIKYVGFRLMDIDGTPNAVLTFAFAEGAEIPENMNSFIQNWVTTSYKINGALAIKKKK